MAQRWTSPLLLGCHVPTGEQSKDQKRIAELTLSSLPAKYDLNQIRLDVCVTETSSTLAETPYPLNILLSCT